MRQIACTTILVLACSPSLQSQPVAIKKHFDSGKLQASYKVDEEGRRIGRYVEWWESGRRKIKAVYRKGVLHGKYEQYFENGKIQTRKDYKLGTITRLLCYDNEQNLIYGLERRKGSLLVQTPTDAKLRPSHPRSRDQIRNQLAKLYPPSLQGRYPKPEYARTPNLTKPADAGVLAPEYVMQGIRRVNTYRWLCGLGHDLKASEKGNNLAQHAAAVSFLNGAIWHLPPHPPGLDGAFYEIAARGAKECNLHQGQADLAQAVDGFMDDSDSSNIDHVGHRCWLLTPKMGEIGFGQVAGYVATWVRDESGTGPNPGLVGYPAPGWFPVEYFAPHAAWSLHLDPKRYARGKYSIPQVRLWLLDEQYDLGPRLKLNHKIYNKGQFGGKHTIVFRPELPATGRSLEGVRVLVSVDMISKNLPPEHIRFMVEFFRLDKRK